jgi:uncharacterized protein YmfQ (DUF2313 family)
MAPQGYGTGSYAQSVYKVYDPSQIDLDKLHYYALKKLNPLPQLEGVLDDDLTIEGDVLDQCYYAGGGQRPSYPALVAGLLAELFPSMSYYLIQQWMADYNITMSGSMADQRAAVNAAMRLKGGLSRAYFIGLASALGYSITITEGSTLIFKVGFSSPPATKIPAPLFSPFEQWTWIVSYTPINAVRDQQLFLLFERLRPAWTLIQWNAV